jgi:3-dehydroquinate dehydratase II
VGLKRVLVLNGSNLNLLGEREPQFYGSESWEEIQVKLESYARDNGVEVTCFQSNHEGELIDMLHKMRGQIDLLIFNPGGFTHYSVSLRDAIIACNLPMIEVHLSNIYKREQFRRESLFSDIAIGLICGFCGESYLLALYAGLNLVKKNKI